MNNGWKTVVMPMLLVGALASTALADPAADRCGAVKMKAAGRFGQGLLQCHARSTRRGEAVDAACTSRAASKLSSAFDKADAAGGCATAGDAGSTQALVGADVDAVLAALAPDPDDDARVCASSKMKGSAKHLRALLTCYSAAAARSEGPVADCFSRADAKLDTFFARAEAKGGCTSVGDDGALDALLTAAAEDAVAALSPVCGDAVTGPGQACDGSDDAACPGLCSVSCACMLVPDCGDGVASLPEECDDGNAMDGDGCSGLCVLENASALCAGVLQVSGTSIDAVLVSSAFNSPIHATAPPLDPSRLFVVERDGRIRILDLSDDSVLPQPFLDIADLVGTSGEGGLLSMAFHPDYETNRRFFVNYTNNSGHTTIARYEADPGNPDAADESTAEILLVILQPENNHNGGQAAFGPDGYLYVGMGDGGGGGDPYENAQDDGELLGKMLRFDVDVETPPYYAVPPSNPGYVDGSGELELIWAKGLRNPWRFSFDRGTGDLLIGDVGQGSREEIDWQPAASSGGENWGWDIFEGSVCYEPAPAPMCPAPPVGFTMPTLEYAHFGPCASVVGGFVYRGCSMTDRAGTYFYSDSCNNFVRTFEISGGMAVNAQDRTADATSTGIDPGFIVSFGEDARGELYIVDLPGNLYRIVAH
ncbi:MAG: PQQ-dependent sugar dehydrogenase [Candidatus Binatia bacterium]